MAVGFCARQLSLSSDQAGHITRVIFSEYGWPHLTGGPILYDRRLIMSKDRPVGNHQADIKNANKGTSGTNITYDQNQGNRGKQMNPTPNDANTPPKNQKK